MVAPIRIGIHPRNFSVNPCLLKPTPAPSCFRQAGNQLAPLLHALQSLHMPWKFTTTAIPGCGSAFVKNDTLVGEGLLYMLLNNTVDILGNTCRMDEDRLHLVDFSMPVSYSKVAFVSRKQYRNATHVGQPTAPFATSTWLVFFSVFVAYWGSIAYARVYHNTIAEWTNEIWKIIDIVTYSGPIGTISPQKGRPAVQLWVWTTKMLMALYCIKITSVCFLEQQTIESLRTIQEYALAVRHGKIKFINPDSAPRFVPHSDPDIQKQLDFGVAKFGIHIAAGSAIYDKVLQFDNTEYVYRGIEDFINEDLVAYNPTRRQELAVTVMPGYGAAVYSYAIRKHYAHKSQLQKALIDAHVWAEAQNGILGLSKRKHKAETLGEQKTLKPITLQQIALTFRTAAIGICLSVGALAIEYMPEHCFGNY